MKKTLRIALAVAVALVVTLLSANMPVLAAVVAPTVSTNAATYVAYSTARLNSSLVSDGGEACSVRFQYRESGGAWSDNETEWIAGYTTGQTPWVDVEGLTSDTLYNFRVQARNSEGTIVSGVGVDFITDDTVEAITELKANPKATSILLTWTKGAGNTETTIRYSETTYPTDEDEGTAGYEGALSSYELTGLASGHKYYISAWGKSGTEYSNTYDTAMVTTIAGETEAENPGAPVMPPTWFQSPDYTVLSKIPFYDQVNDFYDTYEVPRASGWFFSTILACIAFGILVLAISKSPMPAAIALSVALSTASLIKLMPLYMMAFTVIFIVGAWQLSSRRTI